MVYFCCHAIDASIADVIADKENLPKKYISLVEFAESYYLKLDRKYVIESSLVALTIISYTLPKRQDLFLLFDAVMQKNLEFLI